MIRVRKIEYVVHVDLVDDDGNVVEEIATQQPLSAYAHQLDQIETQVAGVVAQAEAQLAEQAAPVGKWQPGSAPRSGKVR